MGCLTRFSSRNTITGSYGLMIRLISLEQRVTIGDYNARLQHAKDTSDVRNLMKS